MNKAVLTILTIYLVGLALYPLMESLASGFSLSRKQRYSICDREFEVFLMIVKSVCWPVVTFGWAWVLWMETIGGAGEWVHDKLVEYKHRRGK